MTLKHNPVVFRLAAAPLLLCFLLLTACSGGGQGGFTLLWGVSIRPPASVAAGSSPVWQANVFGGPGATISPYTVVWDFGGGAEPNFIVSDSTHARQVEVSPRLLPGTWRLSVTVTDGWGNQALNHHDFTVLP